MRSSSDRPRLAGLYRYPVKSTAGQALERARVTEEGLFGDRRYMLAKPDGTFITARSHPQLQRVVALPVEGGLALSAPELAAIEAREANFSARPFATGVWGDAFAALTTTEQLDDWFSAALGESARLLWLGPRSPRYRERTSATGELRRRLSADAGRAGIAGRTEYTHDHCPAHGPVSTQSGHRGHRALCRGWLEADTYRRRWNLPSTRLARVAR